ncbi:helix-turn-helix domain-containing protein [Streptomyces microflavus]|uniref:helix-turn-helix domain-containing protein n=1 Tax=Streptomyces microflavus TaxID=1919 RepID=UPI00364B9B5B
MTKDWVRLGDMLRTARVARRLEQQEVARHIGVQRGALSRIENGTISTISSTVVAYAKLVGWTGESPDLVLHGGEPVMADTTPTEPAREADPLAGFSLDVQQALREGPLLQSRVEEVVTPSGKVRATIVIRGEDGAAPEDLLAILRALKIDVRTAD